MLGTSSLTLALLPRAHAKVLARAPGKARSSALALCLLLASAPGASEGEGGWELELDAQAVAPDGKCSGTLRGPWDAKRELLSLVWLDDAGRVLAHLEPGAAKDRSSGWRFALPLRGLRGAKARIAALLAKRRGKEDPAPEDWEIVAQHPFEILDPSPQRWEFQVLSDDPALLEALEARGVSGLTVYRDAPDGNPRAWDLIARVTPDPAAQALGAPAEERYAERLRTHVLGRRPDAPPLKPQPLDEAAAHAAREALAGKLALFRGQRVLAYLAAEAPSLGLGNAPYEIAPGEPLQELFLAWLRRRYGTLKELNDQWDAQFARWEEAYPPTTDEIRAQHHPEYARRLELLTAGDPKKLLPRRDALPYFTLAPGELREPGGENFSSWCDWHAFLDFAFARELEEYRSGILARDPSARVGVAGALEPSAWGGYDWSRLPRVADGWILPAGSLAEELARAFAPEAWRLAALPGAGTRRALWEAFLNDGQGVLLSPAGDASDPGRGKTAPEGLPEDLAELSGGLAAQRARLGPRGDPIALYYSPRSFAVHWLLDSQLDGSDWPNRRGAPARAGDSAYLALQAWRVLLRDLGYEPFFVHPEQLLAGTFQARVLILPKVLALSDGEAEAIRAWVKRGGTALADSQCGLFDGSGKRRAFPKGGGACGILDEAFGIRRVSLWAHELNGAFHGDAKEAQVFLEDPRRPEPVGPASSELRVNEPGLRGTGAWRFGRTNSGGGLEQDTAAVLSRAGGLGRFVYLNLAIQDYPSLRGKVETDFQLTGMRLAQYTRTYGRPSGGEALRVVIGDLLWEALGGPYLKVERADGGPLRGARYARWGDGRAALYAVLASAPARARLRSGQRAHWYDARGGAYLGLENAVDLDLEGERAAVVAALPYRVEKLEARVRRLDPLGLFRLELTLRASSAGAEGEAHMTRHLLRLSVFDAQGRELPEWRRIVETDEGAWSGTFALGFNLPAGTYRLAIRDVLSGLGAEADLVKAEGYGRVFPYPLSRAERSSDSESPNPSPRGP